MTEEFIALSHLQSHSNGKDPVFQPSPNFRSQLLRWYNGNPFDTDEVTLDHALKAFQWCGANSSIFEFPPEMRRASLKAGAQTLGISVGNLADLMAREDIFHRPTRACQLIAFEGIDDTQILRQIDLLRNHLLRRQVDVELLDCSEPGGFFGREIARLREGDADNEFVVDPKSMALWNALDRKTRISDVLKDAAPNCLVISNRYTLSSAVYHSMQRDGDLGDWIFEMEHTYLSIPAPDLYILLDKPPSFDPAEGEQSVDPRLPLGRMNKSRKLPGVSRLYREFAARFPQIQVIGCMADNHTAKAPEEIHIEILTHLRRTVCVE